LVNTPKKTNNQYIGIFLSEDATEWTNNNKGILSKLCRNDTVTNALVLDTNLLLYEDYFFDLAHFFEHFIIIIPGHVWKEVDNHKKSRNSTIAYRAKCVVQNLGKYESAPRLGIGSPVKNETNLTGDMVIFNEACEINNFILNCAPPKKIKLNVISADKTFRSLAQTKEGNAPAVVLVKAGPIWRSDVIKKYSLEKDCDKCRNIVRQSNTQQEVYEYENFNYNNYF